ncbi:Smad nuclear-interacting protein 1 [Cyphellophora attinorum]|uniref:Smad nuclear-interacting protein 1 n=1 Tax=Cyphellophora attinorum TaxID=1664694 RepID=A0A0N1NX18_9EURO|nr:Smad nuclear-interacting protein 1 [Phialophora attinorum]KPI37467.1 Smad nuclear-interacting protein 1 [Phialophora attinorum]
MSHRQDYRRGRDRSSSPYDDHRHSSSRRDERDDGREARRKRSRSRSVDRPRKRRSVTPPDHSDRRRSHTPDSDHRSKRRRSRSPRNSRRDGDALPYRRERGSQQDYGTSNHRPRRNKHSRSPPRNGHNGHEDRQVDGPVRSKAPLPSQNDAFTGTDSDYYKDKDGNLQKKEKPNWAPTGRLAAAANTIQTANQRIILKYHEPVEARKPPASQQWRMYVFKDSEILETIELYTQSCWLFGRESAVVDVLLEHSSCSKQHAVLQFRYREERGEFGDKKGRVKLYVLDLESANGTTVDGQDVGKARYYEVKDGEMLKFGHSEREYVVQLPPREERKEEAGTAQ